MLKWEKVPPADMLRRWAAIGIKAAAMDHDDIRPNGIEVAVNTINLCYEDGTTIDLGYFRDEPIAVVTYDGYYVTVHVLPHVRQHQLEMVALNYAIGQSRRINPDYPIGFFAENEVIYGAALLMGFSRPEDEDHFADEMLTLPAGKAVSA